MELLQHLESLVTLVGDHPGWSAIIGVIAAALGGTGVFSFLRRPKSGAKPAGDYFRNRKFLSPPIRRPAYSDRMAYILAEMSQLAYYEFEGSQGLIEDTVREFDRLNLSDQSGFRQFLERYSVDLVANRNVNTGFLQDLLSESGFHLIDTIDVDTIQGFACRRNTDTDEPYVVVAFRGTERKVSDWLTDARAIPTNVDGEKRVHTGFYEAVSVRADDDGRTVLRRLSEILDREEAKRDDGSPLPLFITGHSLGGAVALLVTRELAPNITGACYTFGAPRVANYEYFQGVKTPVYRVVNSSDVVPRVPPGAVMVIIINLVRALRWLTGFVPSASVLFDSLERWLDKLSGYRHFGDLRFLTDVRSGRFDQVQLLRNPPAIDRVMWFWRHLMASLYVPLESHQMTLYRKKLAAVASARNNSA